MTNYESELEEQNERLRYELEKAQRELDELKTPMEAVYNTVYHLYDKKWRVVTEEHDRWSGPSEGEHKDFHTKEEAEAYAEEMRYPKDRSGVAPDYYVNSYVKEI